MKSGAWRKSIQSGAALGGITISILTFYYGKGRAKFSKKAQKAYSLTEPSARCLTLYFKKRFMPSRSMIA